MSSEFNNAGSSSEGSGLSQLLHDDNEQSCHESTDAISEGLSDDEETQLSFPNDDYFAIIDGLNHVHGPSFHAIYLLSCMRSVVNIVKFSNRALPSDVESARRFIRETLNLCFERFKEEAFLRLNEPLAFQLFESVYFLLLLAVHLLRYSNQVEPDGLDIEPETSAVLVALTLIFDTNCPLYSWQFAEVMPMTYKWVPQTAFSRQRLVRAEYPNHRMLSWHFCFLGEFSKEGGWHLLHQVLQQPERHSIQVLELVSRICSKAMEEEANTDFEEIESIHEATGSLCGYLLTLMEPEGHERLAENGRDRTFATFSRILENMYSLTEDVDDNEFQLVASVQRKFISVMLPSSNFNRLLAAVRECKNMLQSCKDMIHRTDSKCGLMESHIQWLAANNIIPLMLRSNLHQRQYAEQVLGILKILTLTHSFSEEHLDLLWALTEQEGTFDTVKMNVYFMLADLAPTLPAPILEALMSRFESGKARQSGSVTDAQQLLDLMKRLAQCDKDNILYPRLLPMAWELTTAVDATPDILGCNALPDLVRIYEGRGLSGLVEQYLAEAATVIRAAPMECHQVLCVLRGCLHIRKPKGDTGRASLAQTLDIEFQIQNNLVIGLAGIMTIARQARSGARAQDAGTGTELVPQSSLPSRGCYSYSQLVEEYVKTITFVAETQTTFYSAQLLERLWDEMVANPAVPKDCHQGLLIMNKMVQEDIVDIQTIRSLLELRLVKFPPSQFNMKHWELFSQIFLKVNESMKAIAPSEHPGRERREYLSLDLAGLPYLWKIVLEAAKPDLVLHAMDLLMNVYHAASPPNPPPLVHTARCEFIKQCTQYLMQDVALLLSRMGVAFQPASQGAADTLAQLRVTRGLNLLKEMMMLSQGRTMPSPPCHRATFRGPRLTLDVQVQSPQVRFQVQTHTHEYVGALRRRVAEHVGVDYPRIRLLYAGQEWSSDALLVGSLALRGRQVLNIGISPQDNTFSRPQPPTANQAPLPSPASMLSSNPEMYVILFKLADSAAGDVRNEASALLGALPTWEEITAQLTRLLADPSPAQRLRSLIMRGDKEQLSPSRVLYTLQALHGMMFKLSPSEESSPQGEEEAKENTADRRDAAASLRFGGGGETCADVRVVSACVPLLSEVVEWAERATEDIAFLRELHTLIVNMLLSILTAHYSSSNRPPLGFLEAVTNGVVAVANRAPTQPECSSGCSEAADHLSHASLASTPPTPCPPIEDDDACSAGPNPKTSTPPAPPPPTPAPVMDKDVLANLGSLLVRLTLDAARLWGGAPNIGQAAGPTGRDTELSPDVQLVRDGLLGIVRLVEAAPGLAPGILSDPRAADMVGEVLINTHYANVRSAAVEALTRLCVHGSAGPEGHAWLMAQLTALRERAARWPKLSTEFYCCFVEVINALAEVPQLPHTFDMASQLLREEVESLGRESIPTSGPASTSGDGSAIALEGRLKLVAALLRAIDGHVLGQLGEIALLQLLLKRYLFPESILLTSPGALSTPPSTMASALLICASAPGPRRAALDLASDLMSSSKACLQEGVGQLSALHYSPGFVMETSWEQEPPSALRPAGGYVGLKNGGATCYMNAVLQQLFMQPQVRASVLAALAEQPQEAHDSVLYQMQVMFAALYASRQGFFIPRGFWGSFRDYDGSPLDLREHQDAYEFFTRLQDGVDGALRASGREPALGNVMGGRFAQQIICRSVDYRSEREEEFYQISVDVRGKYSLERSLEAYVQGELMEGENAYYCEAAGAAVTAVRRTVIKTLPQTLVVHLKRFEYDHINASRFKVRDRFEFPLQLDMFKYTAEGLASLESTGGISAPSSPVRPKHYYQYELRGVVVHTGTAFAGHYYSYVKERPRMNAAGAVVEGRWFCFDDKNVTQWDVSSLEYECFGGRVSTEVSGRLREVERPHSAYMLFYERRDPSCYDWCVPDLVPAPVPTPSVSQPQTSRDAHESQMDSGTSTDTSLRSKKSNAQLLLSCPAAVAPLSLMPPELYQGVMLENLRLMHRLHVLDRDYFRFVLRVCEARAEGRARCGGVRKSRRLGDVPSNTSGSSTTGAAGGAPIRSMSCDGEGGAPGGAGEEVSSVREGDGSSSVEMALLLAVRFLFTTYLPACASLRGETNEWCELIQSIVKSNASAAAHFLNLLVENSHWIRAIFTYGSAEVTIIVNRLLQSLFSAALHHAAAATASAAAGPSPNASTLTFASNIVNLMHSRIQQIVSTIVALLLPALDIPTPSRPLPDLRLVLQVLTQLASSPGLDLPRILFHTEAFDKALLVVKRLMERITSPIVLHDPDQQHEYQLDLKVTYQFLAALLCRVALVPRAQQVAQGGRAISCAAEELSMEECNLNADIANRHGPFLVRPILYSPTCFCLLPDPSIQRMVKQLTCENVALSDRVIGAILDQLNSGEEKFPEMLSEYCWPLISVPDHLYDQRLQAITVGRRPQSLLAIARNNSVPWRRFASLWLMTQAFRSSEIVQQEVLQTYAKAESDLLMLINWMNGIVTSQRQQLQQHQQVASGRVSGESGESGGPVPSSNPLLMRLEDVADCLQDVLNGVKAFSARTAIASTSQEKLQ